MKIAFGYKMGVGKDTATEYLVNKCKGTHLSFASPLYDIMCFAQQTCGFEHTKDRHFLQYVGTEWARHKDNNVWIRLLLDKSKDDTTNYFVSDMRFINEFMALKNNGWICIKINRDDVDPCRNGSGAVTHISETELDNVDDAQWDYIINNNSSINELFSILDKIYNDNL